MTTVMRYENQVGGHCHLLRLMEKPNILLKHASTQNEALIYKAINQPGSDLSLLKSFVVPLINHTALQQRPTADSSSFILMKDLLYNYQQPSVIDFKMGVLQRSLSNHTPDKLAKQLHKCFSSTSWALGFRLCGYKTFKNPLVLNQRTKTQCRNISNNNLSQVLRECFTYNDQLQFDLITFLVRNLNTLSDCLRRLPGYRFWGSSLLVFWDAANSDFKRGTCLIDFTNTAKLENCDTPDLELLFGVRNLLAQFEKLLADGRGVHPRLI